MGNRKMFLIGQKHNKKIIDDGRLDKVGFLIIKGPAHYGKTYLAKYIANYYKMNYIQLDYKVATVRKLVESSNFDNGCVYHFKDFEKASSAAKAAILKIAEETPSGVKIIITTQTHNLLQTLKSRAYIMNMESYEMDELKEYAYKLNFSSNLMERLFRLHVDITPSLLYKYKEREDIDEIIDLVEDTFNKIQNGLNMKTISEISNNFWKEDMDKIIIYLNTLSSSCWSLKQNRFETICRIQNTLDILNKTKISNHKLLIHNMLMEIV